MDHESFLLVLMGVERHYDRPMKNLFEMSLGVEKIYELPEKRRGER